jgi:Lipocalin-like domain
MRVHRFLKLSAAAMACLLVASFALAGEDEFAGNYELVSATRKILETGQTENTFGKKPKGLAMYGSDGRFIVLITYDGRPKPESIEKMTDQQRADLHRTMTAYGGTYTFDGSKVVHHLDLSWNEVWAGTTNIRDIQRDGDQVIYTTRPAPFASDGKMSVVTLVWKKLR